MDTSAARQPLSHNAFAGLAIPAAADTVPALPERVSATIPDRQEEGPSFRVVRTRKGGFPVTVENRAKGKRVTVIRQVEGDAAALLALLRKQCGAGGVARDGSIEVQGDHKQAVEAILRALA